MREPECTTVVNLVFPARSIDSLLTLLRTHSASFFTCNFYRGLDCRSERADSEASSRGDGEEAEGSTSEFLLGPFSSPPFEGNFLGLVLFFFLFFLLVTFSNLFFTDFCVLIAAYFPAAGPGQERWLAAEPGSPAAEGELCPAAGSSGLGCSRRLWVASRAERRQGWLFSDRPVSVFWRRVLAALWQDQGCVFWELFVYS